MIQNAPRALVGSFAWVLAVTVVLGGMLAGPGCSTDPKAGYTMADQYRPGIHTVAVPIWTRGRQVYRRGLEFRLSEALAKRIELDTPYKVVGKDRADTQIEGRIDRIDQQVLSNDPDTGRPRELEVTLVLSFTWKDLRTGKILVKHDNFRVADSYITHEPVGEDFFQGSEADIDKAARRIVETMEADW